MEVAKDFQLGSSKEGRRKLTMITRRFHALLSKKRHIVGGVIGICIVAATLLALLVVGANPGCSGRWGCASPRAANNMRLSALARLSEAIYEDVQSRLDEEIDGLDANAFMDSEALKAQRERMNLKYILGDYFPRTNLKYIWDYFPPTNACPLKEKVGATPGFGDSGKWVCGVRTLLQKRPCVVYSFGSNSDTSFEEDLLVRAPHCEVHIFDPTLDRTEVQDMAAIDAVEFHDFGLGAKDQRVAMGPTQAMHRPLGSRLVQLHTLETIMGGLGHTWLDVLKVDVEGFEWGVLEALVGADEPLPFTQLQVEYHVLAPDGLDEGIDPMTPRHMLDVMRALLSRGLRVFHVEPNYWWKNSGHQCVEFAYVQVNDNGQIITSLEEAAAADH